MFAYALREDGSVADYFAHALRLHLAKVRPTLASGGFKFWGELDLAAGQYQLRVLARNAETGAYGVTTVPLAVAEPASSSPSLRQLLFPDHPTGKWLLAREQGASADESPFVLRGEGYLPAARPLLRRGVAAEMVVVGRELEAGPSLTAQLHDASGNVAGPARVEVLAGPSPAGGVAGEVELLASVRVDDAAPGRYTLRVTAGTARSEIEVEVE